MYPTLEDTSDDEHVFKPRGRRRNDETWSPKARVQVGAERGARPHREGARREAVDRALGQTAARGALLPVRIVAGLGCRVVSCLLMG